MIGHEESFKKKIFRELREEIGKYLVVFILMTATIGFVSGFLVADGSMLTAYNNSFQKYNIEDGKFETEEKIYKNQQEDIEKKGVTLYENFYVEKVLLNGTTLRIFKKQDEGGQSLSDEREAARKNWRNCN